MKRDHRISFGRNLTALMKDRALRITDVAALAQVSKSVVHGWMTGTNPRDLRAVKRLADALNVQFSELLIGETERLSSNNTDLRFENIPLFDGICRVRIEKVISRKD